MYIERERDIHKSTKLYEEKDMLLTHQQMHTLPYIQSNDCAASTKVLEINIGLWQLYQAFRNTSSPQLT